MAIGKIASFLNSLSPAKEPVAEWAPDEAADRKAEAASGHGQSYERQHADPNHIAFQLQTMVGAVRALNDNAAEQGAALALSPAGLQLKNAVIGLGHLLTAVDGQAMATGAAAPVREAAEVTAAVETSLAASQSAAADILRTLPAEQAERVRSVADGFQRDMRAALAQVHTALHNLRALA
jgi:hypothetical protein